MRRAERLAALAFLLTAAPACRADTLPPQIYFATFVVNAVPLGIAPDASGAAYLLTDDGIVSRVSTQGVVSAACAFRRGLFTINFPDVRTVLALGDNDDAITITRMSAGRRRSRRCVGAAFAGGHTYDDGDGQRLRVLRSGQRHFSIFLRSYELSSKHRTDLFV